jgi:hypothetical protein
MRKRSSAWIFETHYQGTFEQAGQALDTALLRLYVIAIYKPLTRLFHYWKIGSK